MNVIVDRRRKIPSTTFLRILGLSTDQDIAGRFFDTEMIKLDDFKKGATKITDLPRFVGESIVEEIINPKTGKKMASPGTKVTKKLIDQFKLAGIKKVVLTVAEAYEDVLAKTSTDYAPWHVVPGNRKWYRDWVVATILVDALKGLKMKYPVPQFDVDAARSELEAMPDEI
jgi:DNA-directed RNA polymerase beta subunit